MDISVIIPCSKSHINFLYELFDALSKQDYHGEWEIILVVEDCIESKNIDNEIKNKYKLKYRIIYSNLKDPGANRNLALLNINNKYIAFTDSDCIPYSNWLSEIVKMLECHDGVQGIDYSYDDTTLGKFLEKKQIEFLKNSLEQGKCRFIDTRNFAVRTDVIKKVGTFDETLPASEDVDLGYRIYKSGFNVILNENMIVLHRWQKGTIWGFFKWGKWYGKGDYIFNKKWRKYDTPMHMKDAFGNINSSLLYLMKSLKYNDEINSVHLLFSVREIGVAWGKLEMLVKDSLSF